MAGGTRSGESRRVGSGAASRGGLAGGDAGGSATAGWHVEDTRKNCAFCFGDRENERGCVGVECFEPGSAGAPRL
jgi:hypothetical protein